MEYTIIALFIWFLLQVYRGYFQHDIVTQEYLILAIMIAIPAELCFTVFTQITDFYNVLGHILKISYYYFLLQAVLAGFVVYPYKMLHDSETRFHQAFKYSPILKSIVSLQDFRYLDVNYRWEQTMGYCQSEVIGKTAAELKILSACDYEDYRESLSRPQMGTNKKYTFYTREGNARQGITSVQEILLDGEPCVLMATMDITEQLRKEKELTRLDRLNLVGQMAAGLGHEVRNPMTAVRGFLQLLSSREKSDENKEYYRIMMNELDRANAIISDFLTLARDKSADISEHNLNQVIDDLFPLLQATALNADKNIEWKQQPTDNVMIDSNEIRQLLLNLVQNSLEAMGDGGKVTLCTFSNSGETVLAVTDEGTGIAPEILEKMGTPFVTTKENGTGLGLATCYSIAERNHAQILVDTNSSGTTFIVKFQASA